MPNIVDLIGDTVVRANGDKIRTEKLAADGQIVGLYFSAQWCPPCRGFTPKLIEFYKSFKDKKLEVVFISSDRDDKQFTEYFQEMPWFALPFEDRDRKAKLSKKFQVQGIPSLVFVEGRTAKLITKDGRNNMLEDPEGKDFPWYPQPLSELLKGELHSHAGQIEANTALSGKVCGLYFSAHWCPPCRGFTPTLVETYTKLKEAGKNFEVVFVSSDRSEESYNDYFSTMPWLAIPYGNTRNTEIAKYFGVQGIPTLIFLNEDLDTITANGRAVLTRDTEGQDFPWYPKAVSELNDITAPFLNESACLLYFTDGEEEHISAAVKMMSAVAQKYTDEFKATKNTDNEMPELKFLYEGPESDEIADSLRTYADLDERTPLIVIIDIPEQQYHVVLDEIITQDVVQRVANDFRSSSLQFLPLKR